MPHYGEIMLFAGSLVPIGYVPCEGQALGTRRHSNVFAAVGAEFGGDGRTTFHLPDLRAAGKALDAAEGAPLRYLLWVGMERGSRFASDAPPGTITLFAGKRPPTGLVPCEGQTVAVAEHRDLADAIGTTYGGDGTNEIQLPDLRSAERALRTSCGITATESAPRYVIASGSGPRSGFNGLMGQVLLDASTGAGPPGTRACDGTEISATDNAAVASLCGVTAQGSIRYPDLGGASTALRTAASRPEAGPGLAYVFVDTGVYPIRG